MILFNSTRGYFLFIFFMPLSFLGYGQEMKLGFRSGLSFSNFYAHHSPAEIPRFSFQVDPNKSPILLEPMVNYSPTSYYYETDFIQDMRVGFFSYFYLDWKLEKRLSAEIGLGYSQKGIDIKYNLYSTFVNSDNSKAKLFYQFNRNLRLDYMVIPLTVQYKLGRKEQFYVLAGIYNAIAINFSIYNSLIVKDKQIFNLEGQLTTNSVSKMIHGNAYASMFDSGLVSGFGVNFPLAKRVVIGMDIRSSVGMVSIPRKYKEYGFQSFNQSTKNINFETGLKLQYIL